MPLFRSFQRTCLFGPCLKALLSLLCKRSLKGASCDGLTRPGVGRPGPGIARLRWNSLILVLTKPRCSWALGSGFQWQDWADYSCFFAAAALGRRSRKGKVLMDGVRSAGGFSVRGQFISRWFLRLIWLPLCRSKASALCFRLVSRHISHFSLSEFV